MLRTIGTTVVVGASLLAGCSSSEAPREETLGRVDQPVIGGTVSTGDPAVVQMRAFYSGSYGSCTGTLVAPNVVLTAAHCIDDSPKGVSVYLGTYADLATAGEWRTAKSWHQHPQWPHQYINHGHDCAVLVLDQPVSGVTPKPYRKTPMTTSSIGSAARIVGFGHTNGYSQTGGGTKRSLDTTIQEVSDGVLAIGGQGATSCQGDSGGPAFMTLGGVETVAGISSFGVQHCIGRGSYARTELCAAWIDTFVGSTTCTPSCGGKSCGDDGCGGTCGTCSGGQTCNAQGACAGGGGSSGGGTVCLEQEPNDQFMSASATCPRMKGTLASSNDSDSFTFAAAPGSTYDVQLINTPASVNIGLYRVTSSGFHYVGAGEDAGGGTRRIWRTTQVGGTYYLSVYRYQVGSAPGESWEVTVDITK